jgi:nitronate monooxygenase
MPWCVDHQLGSSPLKIWTGTVSVAALALGAEGVQIGTAFLACAGSGANTSHREALLSKDTTRTELTDKFTGRLARGIKNHLMDELNDIDSTVMPFPLQHALV